MPAQTLKTILKDKLKDAKRIALLGVGSELRADDVAGLQVAESLLKFRPKKKIGFKVFIGETAPENLTGEIRRFKPTHLILVDSVDVKKKPGSIVLIAPEESAGISFCTHRLPIKIMTDFLTQDLHCEVVIIGIQPKTLEFNQPPSKFLGASVKKVVQFIKEVLSK